MQREYKVVIAGPTTLWAILNSLQMGFRTLSVQKRSSEVWNLLGAVKTEWSKYGETLEKVQKRLNEVFLEMLLAKHPAHVAYFVPDDSGEQSQSRERSG